jgi:hypothetical protein
MAESWRTLRRNGEVERQSYCLSADVVPWRGSFGGEDYSILSTGALSRMTAELWTAEAMKFVKI